jgi:hypothetical protein
MAQTSMLRAEASVYTVHVGKKSAWLMMLLVAFGAAMPALASLKPAQADACCRQMMQGCGSCDVGASQSCCQVHAPDTGVPLGRATQVERLVPLMPMDAGRVLPVPAACGVSSCQTVEAIPPIPRAGSSVLRI